MAFPFVALLLGIFLSPCLEPVSVWACLPLAVLISFHKRWCGLIAVTLLGAGVASLTPSPPAEAEQTTAVRIIGRMLSAPEQRGPGVYMDIALESIDARPASGRARLTEFLDDADQRSLFDALALGSGDRLEILVRLRRPAVYRDPGVFNYRRQL